MSSKVFQIAYLRRPASETFEEVTRANPSLAVTRIPIEQSEASVQEALSRAHGYYVASARDELPVAFRVNADFLARMPRLLVAVTYGAGYDTVDLPACTRAGVAVVNQAGGNAEGVAEHAMAMMLSLVKRIPEAHIAMRAGSAARREAFMGRELVGRTVGIVGLGHIGTRVAALTSAFGCRPVAYDPYLDAATCKARGAEKVDKLETLLAQSDVVTLHCPFSDQTRGMLGRAAFAAMRPDAIFITTARGGIHDEAALQDALSSGHLGGAGLDVWAKEPPAPDHPLLAHPRVMASVHTAGVTSESRARVARMAAEAFIAAAAGQPLPRLLNPEVLPRYKERWQAAFG